MYLLHVVYRDAGHVITGNLKVISDSRIRNIISKGPKYSFPNRIYFKKCREEIASSLSDVGSRWCKREHVESDALKEWKVNVFNVIDKRINLYSQNTNLLQPKPKSTFRHLKLGIQEFHRKYVLVPADKAANNVVVETGTERHKAYEETSENVKSVVFGHCTDVALKFSVNAKEQQEGFLR